MKLILGVDDVAYSENGKATTTGDVAEILEDNYHVMRTFVELHESEIADALADSLTHQINAISRGQSVSGDPNVSYKSAMRKIEKGFRHFLDMNEIASVLPASQQSHAALKGVNHRKKHPYAKANKARPHFIDTGLYQASFRAWLNK